MRLYSCAFARRGAGLGLRLDARAQALHAGLLVWAKALTTIGIFEATLAVVQSKARDGADIAARIASGELALSALDELSRELSSIAVVAPGHARRTRRRGRPKIGGAPSLRAARLLLVADILSSRTGHATQSGYALDDPCILRQARDQDRRRSRFDLGLAVNPNIACRPGAPGPQTSFDRTVRDHAAGMAH